MKLGIVGAMPEEMEKIFEIISDKQITYRGDRVYYEGKINDVDVICVFSRWGKVAAATTVTNLIVEFGVEHILFVGIAGALSTDLNIGDIVVAQRLYQHDMDARPLMQRFEIPLTGKTSFELSDNHVGIATKAAHQFLKKHNKNLNKELLKQSEFIQPRMMVGDIATGDLFIASESMCKALNRNLPSALCADMESAAVAQVCSDYRIPLNVIRAISDNANEDANKNCMDFVTRYGGNFLLGVVLEYTQILLADMNPASTEA